MYNNTNFITNKASFSCHNHFHPFCAIINGLLVINTLFSIKDAEIELSQGWNNRELSKV